MADDKRSKLHIAMLPWLAFGHLMPYLQVAKQLAQKGHKISFISTPRNIQRLPKLASNLEEKITFIQLELPCISGLPEGAQATSDIPTDKVGYLMKAYDGLKDQVTNFLESSSPDWILYDLFAYWIGSVAAKLRTRIAFFSVVFSSSPCYFYGTYHDMMEPTEERKKPEGWTTKPDWIPFETVVHSHYEATKIPQMYQPDVSGVSFSYRFGLIFKECDAIVIKGCTNFDPEWLRLLSDLHQKPVLPVGLLPPTQSSKEEQSSTDSWKDIKEWLDKQRKESVVYVAFGSEFRPTQDELTKLTLGLELSGLPFFWVLSSASRSEDEEALQLPDEFEERTKKQGVVWRRWAPQLLILSHDSVGGFMTHAGSSSIVEAPTYGKPMIMFSLHREQTLTAKLMERRLLGRRIPRDDQHGSFTKELVADTVRLVMVEEEGQRYRNKAKKMAGLLDDVNRQNEYIDRLLDYLHNHVKPDNI